MGSYIACLTALTRIKVAICVEESEWQSPSEEAPACALAPHLAALPSLRCLQFAFEEGMDMDADDAAVLPRRMCDNTALTQLELPTGGGCSPDILDALSACSRLAYLGLRGMWYLSRGHVRRLGQALSRLSGLKVLRLGQYTGLHTGQDELIRMAKVAPDVAQMTQLEELQAHSGVLNQRGALTLTKLTCLVLYPAATLPEQTPHGGPGRLQNTAQLLEAAPVSLRHLCMAVLERAPKSALAGDLSRLTNLTALSLQAHPEAGIERSLASGLSVLVKLEVLMLQHVHLRARYAAAIGDALARLTRLTQLSVESCGMEHGDVDTLAPVLPCLRALQHLSLRKRRQQARRMRACKRCASCALLQAHDARPQREPS
jgi:hypothetical protein